MSRTGDGMIQILLATWNSSRYLKEQLDSLFQQTNQDFELLIHDGGSTDNTLSLIEDYEKRYQGRIRFLGSHPCDACSNFACLLEKADGDLFMFCDHDDVWLPNKIQRTLDSFRQAQKEYGEEEPLLVFTDSEITDRDMNTLSPSMMRSQKLNRSDFSPGRLIVQNSITGNVMLFNKALRDISLPIPKEALMHDYYLALAAAFFGKIIYLDEPLIRYRQHNANVIGAFRYSLLNLIRKLLSDPWKLHQNIARKVRQAAILLDSHSDLLKQKDLARFSALKNFENMGFLEKRVFFLRNKIRAEGFLRNLALYLFL